MVGNHDVTFEQLIDWVEGRLSPGEAEALATKVGASGQEVQAQVRWLRSFMQLSDAIVLTAPPVSVRAELAKRFVDSANARRQPGVFQRIAAALSFDSTQLPVMAGVRAGDSGQTREMVFATEPLDVALTIHPHEKDPYFNLLGQILPNDAAIIPDMFAVQLVRDGNEMTIIMADEMGEFGFTTVASGDYWLVVSSDTLEVTLPTFALTR
jgi:hypothetical protein